MTRLQNTVNWIAVTSQISHFFCCGIPVVISVFSLLANTGILISMPAGLEYLHELVHGYEAGIIAMSAVILLLGWGLHFVAKRLDCRDTGCGHPPCDTNKTRSSRILLVATLLFAVNVASYYILHS